MNAGDIDAAVQSFAENAVDHDPAPRPGTRTGGLQGLLHCNSPRRSRMRRIEPAEMVADDDNDRRRLHANRYPSGSTSTGIAPIGEVD